MRKAITLSSGQVLACHCVEDLGESAEALLAALSRFDTPAKPLCEGETIRFGWSVLKLKRIDGELVACEPDFSVDPQTSFVADVSRTLRVQSWQVDVCRRAGAVGTPEVCFDQNVVAVVDALHLPTLYLDRRSTSHSEFSGWFIGDTFDVASAVQEDRLQVLPVYKLLSLRPLLLALLQLPVGYFAQVEREKIAVVFDSNGELVGGWHRIDEIE